MILLAPCHNLPISESHKPKHKRLGERRGGSSSAAVKESRDPLLRKQNKSLDDLTCASKQAVDSGRCCCRLTMNRGKPELCLGPHSPPLLLPVASVSALWFSFQTRTLGKHWKRTWTLARLQRAPDSLITSRRFFSLVISICAQLHHEVCQH